VTADHPVNLFTLLSTGMGLNVFEAGTDLCPESICSGATYVSPERRRLDLLADAAAIALHRIVPEPWAGGLPPVDLGWAHFWPSGRLDSGKPAPADRALVRFDRFLDRMADYPRETLHFIHLHVPHLPWIRLPSGQRYESAEVYPHGLENQLWIGSEWEMLQAWQRHLLQVGLVDTLVGRLTARLRDLALDDETLLVITSDHGTSFRHRGLRRNLNRLNLTELVNIPLFVRRPGGPAGKIDERNATTLDLLPTILASVGIEEPEGLAGRSLFGPPPQSDDKRTYRGGSRRTKRGIALSYRTADLDRAELVERVAGWFGAGDWRLVFRLSLRPELLDRSPDALLSDEPPLELVLRHGWGLARFEPAADVLPIHLAGRLRGWSIEQDPVDLAIAVRGSIVATTRTFVAPGRAHRFTALLDPTRLEPGDNELRIFLVEGDANDPRLRATRLTRPRRRARRPGAC
ncbi:MAG: sulfatase-like hydrolase/transferase, partial [Acidobacteria bacterium]|nr:sulfatase-like hydrolase/transferase [Acidobacteriota bacterium]